MDKNDKKRFLIAIVLWTLILAGFYALNPQMFSLDKKPVEPANQTVTKQENSHQVKKKTKPVIKRRISQKKIAKQTLEVKTDKYNVKFSNQGARIESLVYGERKIELVAGKKLKVKSFFNFPLHFNEDQFQNGNELDQLNWKVKKVSDKNIVFSTNYYLSNAPVIIEKEYKFNQSQDYFNVTYRIKNLSRQNITLPNNYIIFSASDFLGPKMEKYDTHFNRLESVYMLNNEYDDGSKGSDYKQLGKVDWVGISSRYFVSLMLAEGFDGTGVIWDSNKDSQGMRTGMFVRVENIPGTSSIEKKFKICIAPKKSQNLAAVDPSLKYTFTSKWKEPLVYFVLWCLNKLYALLGNYGWALVIFSIFTKLVFLPLTKKSTESMKKMSALSPLLQELKAKYKDRPDVLQKETMKLYREQGVNPLGGCLPILIQMPFFYALYTALGSSLELFHAPFILWIKDLSMPDVVAHLPFLDLVILPIIMVTTTFLQQKLTMADNGGAGQQQMMMKIMPVIMLLIFWNMPSGLVLYWIVQNVLQIAHQVYINKKEA